MHEKDIFRSFDRRLFIDEVSITNKHLPIRIKTGHINWNRLDIDKPKLILAHFLEEKRQNLSKISFSWMYISRDDELVCHLSIPAKTTHFVNGIEFEADRVQFQ